MELSIDMCRQLEHCILPSITCNFQVEEILRGINGPLRPCAESHGAETRRGLYREIPFLRT